MSFELRRERVGGDMERLARAREERFRNGVEADVEADVTIVSLCLFVFIYMNCLAGLINNWLVNG
jgi:hypothetical protein